MSSKQSFEGLEVWLNELDTYATKKDLIKMLVANKIDKVSCWFTEWRLEVVVHDVVLSYLCLDQQQRSIKVRWIAVCKKKLYAFH